MFLKVIWPFLFPCIFENILWNKIRKAKHCHLPGLSLFLSTAGESVTLLVERIVKCRHPLLNFNIYQQLIYLFHPFPLIFFFLSVIKQLSDMHVTYEDILKTNYQAIMMPGKTDNTSWLLNPNLSVIIIPKMSLCSCSVILPFRQGLHMDFDDYGS